MINLNTSETFVSIIGARLQSYYQLMKFRLSFLVAFSSGMGYMLAVNGQVHWGAFFLFCLCGFLVTVSSNIINQIVEIDIDALMDRTKNRPLPTGRVSAYEAAVLSVLFGVLGISLLFLFFNITAALLSLISLLLYGFVYTPMKVRNPVAVFIGAIPGALPPMIGWIAATNKFGLEPGILFAIQFFWQFPHYWAIAWVLDDDYKKANIRLLPSNGKRDIHTAFKIMIYTVFLLPLGFMPMILGMTGIVSAIIALVCGVLFLAQTFYLMKECTNKAALQIMFGSFIYLPVVQIAFVLDKLPL